MLETTKLQTANESISKAWSVIQRNLPLALLLVGSIITVIIIQLYVSQPQYRPLYLSSEKFDSAEILSVLDESKVKYQIDPLSGRILVDQRIIGKTRMLLASKGVQGQLPVGLELLVDNSELGTSQFVESARYRHGLEGEIAQTVMALGNVNSARVHLALPDKKSFIRRQNETVKASVFVEVIAGNHLSDSQVTAIMTLVSGSIPELAPENVSVIDAKGTLLSADIITDNSDTRRGVETQNKREEMLAQKARHLLNPIFGPNNFRVTVSANMNFDRVESTSETVLPDSTVRSERTRRNNFGDENASGIPGTLSNQAPGNAGQNTVSSNGLSEAERQYAVSSTISHVKHQVGRLEQLNVAILISQDSTGDNWDADKDELISTLETSLGLSSERGDSLTLMVRPFTHDEPVEIELPAWWESIEFMFFGKLILMLIVSALLILAVIKPIVAHLIEQRTKPAPIPPTESDEPESQTKPGANALDNGAEHLPPAGSPLSVQLHHLQKLSDEEPERVAEILRGWVNETNR